MQPITWQLALSLRHVAEWCCTLLHAAVRLLPQLLLVLMLLLVLVPPLLMTLLLACMVLIHCFALSADHTLPD
jgi:hypothetical protein